MIAPCSACGRQVAGRTRIQRLHGGGKHRVRHKCQHGRWCVAGSRFGQQSWNPGGSAHLMACPECAYNWRMEHEPERAARQTIFRDINRRKRELDR